MKTIPVFNFKSISDVDLNELSDDKWYVITRLNNHRQVAFSGGCIKRIKDKIECIDVSPITESPWCNSEISELKEDIKSITVTSETYKNEAVKFYSEIERLKEENELLKSGWIPFATKYPEPNQKIIVCWMTEQYGYEYRKLDDFQLKSNWVGMYWIPLPAHPEFQITNPI